MSLEIPSRFNNSTEEIKFLRQRLAEQEGGLLADNPEVSPDSIAKAEKQKLFEYSAVKPEAVLEAGHKLNDEGLGEALLRVESKADKTKELLELAAEKGIKNALTVLEKLDNSYLVDEVHSQLIAYIKSGHSLRDLKEDTAPWRLLHKTLFEITLPEFNTKQETARALRQVVSVMEQLHAGLQGTVAGGGQENYALEIAVSNHSEDIAFYIAVPDTIINLFEKQILSLYPKAVITEQKKDYNIFYPNGDSRVAIAGLHKHPIYPLRTDEQFEQDPLVVILNAFSKIERDGGGGALQLIIDNGPKANPYNDKYKSIIRSINRGEGVKDSITASSFSGQMWLGLRDLMRNSSTTSEQKNTAQTPPETIEAFKHKIATTIVEVNLRLVVSAKNEFIAKQTLHEIESAFNQFESVHGNRLTWQRPIKRNLKHALKAFSFREWRQAEQLPLSFTEISTLFHFPDSNLDVVPQLKQGSAKTAAAPNDMPEEGTLLGINNHRHLNKKIYITEKDRLRHFYIIGQTGTGKSVFMKNMIIQDIVAGAGVCMIDPHGTDIIDVLATVPEERIDDVIYFDPANLEQVVGLNMLEYDKDKPEQKTFVVNELFSIFQKLYGGNPESMGPMFEQYFRNATLLVMEHPESGNTLMDISRVMSNDNYRHFKLSHAQNPVVKQFWTDIATKAGGEASLENIVPYIVSKFDVFTANDYMRPIIGQQKSSFNFREIMDSNKILLVNLSKGRLGEINANLIGMIIIGKILMAALSRVDNPTMNFSPFFLHIDEFQNVSTPSIASILSEARKYKLSLTIAHQFISQLNEPIKNAVFGNIGSLAAFRVGQEDGEFLAHQFAPVFEAQDLTRIPNYNAYLRVLSDGTPTRPFSLTASSPPANISIERAEKIKAISQTSFSRPRAEVENEIAARYVI